MRTICAAILAAALAAAGGIGVAKAAADQDESCPVSTNVRGHENIEWSKAYAFGLTDETKDLPRVLLVGDSICNGYQEGVRERLKGNVNVSYWVSSYCVTSAAYLPLLTIYLDEAKYDVIHFNNGLHSLETPTDAWAKGFKAALELIRRKQPEAKIVWCTSTPLMDETKTAKCRELNAAGAKVVAELGGIATNDLFALCDPLDRASNWSDVYHFHAEAKAKQADQVAAAVLSSAYAGVWRKYEGNPVLGGDKLGTCFDVNVVTNGPAPYTMYFSWRPKKAIALVRSEDAMKWTQEPEVCLEANPESGWEDNINRSCTVFKDGVWHMWYTGQAKGGSKIGYATSTDGVHFTRVRRNPVLVPEKDYEKLSTMNPYVRWDEGRKVWRMWYAAGETYEPNVLCYAESSDGLSWKKWDRNPMFGHGPRDSWDRDRVGACEVHPLPDGRWAMFYIGYSDIDTARIGCAISKDGVTGWSRIAQNPIVAPDLCTWDSSATYKPSVVRDERNGRWLLWYNGRNGKPEYVGCAIHDGLDLEEPPQCLPDTKLILSEYVRRFNSKDDELYTNAIPNSAAERFMLANVPRFACPDKDIERTYYFRWWTYRKHLRRGEGGWRVTEFLPKVSWSGADNTIVCPAGHHFREGRWLRDPQYLVDNARFWLADEKAEHRWRYSSWLFTGTCWIAETSGLDSLPTELLDDAVRYYRRWERGDERKLWPASGKGRMGGDGQGGFLSIDNYEGSEFSLGGSGWKPLMNSAMWSEAKSIAAVARRVGRMELAGEFEAKAEDVRRALMEKCWNGDVGFFTTRSYSGVISAVRELHGYAPWYFGVPVDVAPDWAQLSDQQGFAAAYGLSFPERRAKGFKISYAGHECQWNGPSWPFATSIALTALANNLHARPSAEGRRAFDFLMWQYAAQQKRTRAYSEDWTVLPWIDENLNPDKPDWISRTVLKERKAEPRERGKDYNHSTFCDLVISGVVGFVPNGKEGFAIDPLADPAWDYFVLDNLRYRGHDVSIRYLRGEGLVVEIDGKTVAKRVNMGRMEVTL